MVRKFLLFGIISTLCYSCNTQSVNPPTQSLKTQEQKKTVKVVTYDSATTAQKWETYITPSKTHLFLKKMEGKWSHQSKIWVDSKANPIDAKGQCIRKMLLGDRYLQTTFKTFINKTPLEGIVTVGFDNASKKYVSTWIDNLGTGMMYLEGEYDSTDKRIEYEGSIADPISGKDRKIKQYVYYKDVDHQYIEMYEQPEGEDEFKSMEITMVRLDD